jgi:hypothetical protein
MVAAVAVPAAHAGEAARHCEVYHAQGNPNSPWGFEVCVKLVHDPNTHTWWASGSVRSSTPGIKLYLDELYMHNITTNVYYNINTATRYGTGSDFVTTITIKNSCADRRSFEGFARARDLAEWSRKRERDLIYLPTPLFWYLLALASCDWQFAVGRPGSCILGPSHLAPVSTYHGGGQG